MSNKIRKGSWWIANGASYVDTGRAVMDTIRPGGDPERCECGRVLHGQGWRRPGGARVFCRECRADIGGDGWERVE